ncbi:MAG: MBOAT family O-acyltransferase [Eubacteriales bacterium]
MIFSSMIFLFVFLPLVLFGYYGIFSSLEWKNRFLLLASLIFYAWGEPFYILLMLLSIALNYTIGSFLTHEDPWVKKQLVFFGVFANLLILFLFKYEGFVTENIGLILGQSFDMRVESLNLSLPIGISFFTFQGISYLVDVSRGKAAPQKNIFDLGLYIAFFPQLIAGPILRYETIAEQIKERKTSYAQLTYGIQRFILGMSKKIIIANPCSLMALEAFGHDSPSIALAWLGALAYSLQIYYDFSGYSDMAIGLGHIFGFRFLENFNYPYISKTVTEFWRRWHISLGSWFRDYVYIPMGGSRGKTVIRNLFVVWLLTGLWHGADFQFILWGLLYFVLLTFEKMTKIPEKIQNKLLSLLYRLFTLLMVMIGWVIFGESSLLGGLHHLSVMFGNSAVLVDMVCLRLLNNNWFLLLLAVLLSTPILPYLKKRYPQKKQSMKMIFLYEYLSAFAYLLLFYVSVSYLVMGSHNPFIYFNF